MQKVFSNSITSSSRLQKFFSNCSRWDGGSSRIIKVPFKIFDVAFLLLSFSRVSSLSSIEVVDDEWPDFGLSFTHPFSLSLFNIPRTA